MSSAAHRVFGIAELREMIFSHLSDPDLLCHLPRTCKLWKMYIDCSTDIQRRLFFQPILGPRLSLAKVPTAIPGIFKPAWKNNMTGAEFRGAVIKNPAYERLSSGDANHKSWAYPTASWRRMLISKPAIISTRAVVRCPRYGFDRYMMRMGFGWEIKCYSMGGMGIYYLRFEARSGLRVKGPKRLRLDIEWLRSGSKAGASR